uniref:Uncharacterized protein n=1 Tax=Cyprinus carpio carpio TaxID=630221 RepID=A0A9J8CQL9_CYPCA
LWPFPVFNQSSNVSSHDTDHITCNECWIRVHVHLYLKHNRGEDTFELHSVQLELEAVEKQICDLEERQAQLREWRVALETSSADAHKSGSPGAVVLHTGVNDTTLRQMKTLKMEFRSLIKTVCSTTPVATIIVSGPLPTYQRGHER